jgi:hypothetical protein
MTSELLVQVAMAFESAGRAAAAAELRELAALLGDVPGPAVRAGFYWASQLRARTADEAFRVALLADVAAELGRLDVPMGDLRG